MNAIILCSILGAAVFAYLIYFRGMWSECLKLPCIILFGGGGGAVVGLIVACIIGGAICNQVTVKYLKEYQLIALVDDNEIKGSFVLVVGFGGGSVGEEMKYRFYYEDLSGIRMKELPAEDVIIKYSDRPRFIVTEFIGECQGKSNWGITTAPCCDKTEYTLYVPQGAIVSQYNLDLQ